MGGKITENLGFKSPLRKVNFFCSFCSFFQILHTKLGIFEFTIFWYPVSLIRNEIKHVENLSFDWHVTKRDVLLLATLQYVLMVRLNKVLIVIFFFQWKLNIMRRPSKLWSQEEKKLDIKHKKILVNQT